MSKSINAIVLASLLALSHINITAEPILVGKRQYKQFKFKYKDPEKELRRLAPKPKKVYKPKPSRRPQVQYQNFILTFYTSLDCENGYGAITCTGKKLRPGMVANNVLPLGTKIYLEGWGNVVVADRGGSNFNTSNRLDVYIPRQQGETNSQYYKRVNNMGKIQKGGIIK